MIDADILVVATVFCVATGSSAVEVCVFLQERFYLEPKAY